MSDPILDAAFEAVQKAGAASAVLLSGAVWWLRDQLRIAREDARAKDEAMRLERDARLADARRCEEARVAELTKVLAAVGDVTDLREEVERLADAAERSVPAPLSRRHR